MGTEGMNKAKSRDTDFIHSKPYTFIGERESPTCKINHHQKFFYFLSVYWIYQGIQLKQINQSLQSKTGQKMKIV